MSIPIMFFIFAVPLSLVVWLCFKGPSSPEAFERLLSRICVVAALLVMATGQFLSIVTALQIQDARSLLEQIGTYAHSVSVGIELVRQSAGRLEADAQRVHTAMNTLTKTQAVLGRQQDDFALALETVVPEYAFRRRVLEHLQKSKERDE